ncbi:long-chain-fatty-acid--CoA ligase 1-like isoform X2 [Bolinopsis microptera]|uniref:long-chain-fatty-acid--CoA ligase 1-like isoform X2 n=1 Tax=Bolinopsis microptera TaxID=2820187 RepID=UPI00307A399C
MDHYNNLVTTVRQLVSTRMQELDIDESILVPAALTTSALALSYVMYRQAFSLPPRRALPPQLTKEVDAATCERTSIIPDLAPEYLDRWKEFKTAYDCFQNGLKISPHGRCLGERPGPDQPYGWLDYTEVSEKIKRMGSGLIASGFKPGQDTLVGIFAQNSVAWHSTMQMCNHYSMVLVPLYDTLGEQAVQFILGKTQLKLVFTDSKRLDILLKYITTDSSVSVIVLTDGTASSDQEAAASGVGIDIKSLAEIESLGEKALQSFLPPVASDVALICYTSGTTGLPKGAMITHNNVFMTCLGMDRNIQPWPHGKDDCMLSYLPAAHSYQYSMECYFGLIGGSIGFYQGNIKLLLDDIAHLQPTVFPSVPRVLNKLHDRIMEGIGQKPAFVQWLIGKATESKLAEVEQGICRQNSVWDYLIFKKIRKLLGGNIRLVITGSAPIAPSVLQWYRSVLGCFVIEGYGQTENCGVGTMSMYGDTIPGHVGTPAPGTNIKLDDVPDMNYRASEGKGEVCLKGPIVFKGYYQDPEKTAETIDSDGWLHTGDIGTWTPHGCLQIIDRKKNIFKLAQGEYIAPEKIEIAYEGSPLVAQCFVYGDSLKATLVAVVVPEEAAVKAKYGEKVTLQEACGKKEVYDEVMSELARIGKPVLKGFEQVKKVHLHHELFSVENDMATPTFKKKRVNIAGNFKGQLAKLYEGLD